jgi:adenosylhomocysteine nucleosidase
MRDMVLFAMREEAPSIVGRYRNVFEIGVGKVRSAINTTRLIHLHRPKRVINLGTAGGITLGSGIHRARRIVQHDVDLRPLGLEPGHQLGDDLPEIECGGTGHVCGSGDVFVTNPSGLRMPVDMVEMEAYGVARSAVEHGVDVEVWKYISDAADDRGAEDWTAGVSAGEAAYLQTLEELNASLESLA